MKRYMACFVLVLVLLSVSYSSSFADGSTFEYYDSLEKQHETSYYQFLGQWFSLLNRISTKGHVITIKEQTDFKQLFDDLFKEMSDINQYSADSDAEYWAYLFDADSKTEIDPIYKHIIELTYNAYIEGKEEIERLEAVMIKFCGYAFTDSAFSEEEYLRALAIVRELDNLLQEIHPPVEEAEKTLKKEQ